MHTGKLVFAQLIDHLPLHTFRCSLPLYTILQILSLTLFEKTSLNQLVTNIKLNQEDVTMTNQLNLFTEISGQ